MTTSADDRSTRPRRGLGRRILKWLGIGAAVLVGLVVVALLAAGLWLYAKLDGGLPPLEGERTVAGLDAAVTVERDGQGVVTVTGGDRDAVAFGTGFVHAQDRFFQMDLLRRQAAGEMAAAAGEMLLPLDRRLRVHRFRDLAQRVVAAAPPAERSLIESYTAGVNAGLASLGEVPPEYLLLGEPEAWTAADTVLVQLSMYLLLQDENGEYESILSCLHDRLPEPLYTFLTPMGTSWDAPLLGDGPAAPPVPGPGVPVPAAEAGVGSADGGEEGDGATSGGDPGEDGASNAWAVAGSRTADGRALLAADMHVGLTVPNLWYRVVLRWPAEDGGEHEVAGVTVPGLPLVLTGSNGRVAWGFVNLAVDGTDLIRLVPAPEGEGDYMTPQGPASFEVHRETFRVRGGEERVEDVPWTVWGPVVGEDHAGNRLALRWIAHDAEGLDLGLGRLETARDVDEAVRIGRTSGMPALNLLVADDGGRIGWTVAGRVPARRGFSGRLPADWSGGEAGWDGWLAPEELPSVVDPPSGVLWSANNRPVGGEALDRLGDGNYVLGARARQIRDRLLALEDADLDDMLALQLDDRALFLERWHRLLVELLDDEAVAADPRRGEMRRALEGWEGRAAVDSVAYRLVREFRDAVAEEAFAHLTAACAGVPDFDYGGEFEQLEAPLWQLVSERPPHLADPAHGGWRAQLLAAADRVLDDVDAAETTLAAWTWGERNRAAIRHLFSRALPVGSGWLDMPAEPLPGDVAMPRVQLPSYGASQRMALSPGAEEQGYFHMPGGQSGHPMSPHYRDAHPAWVEGAATPFLPGETVHTLTLLPGEAP